jgi:hypothetical protein
MIHKGGVMELRGFLTYVAGPYSADTPKGIDENIKRAKDYAIQIWEIGMTAICPHLNTMNFERLAILK